MSTRNERFETISALTGLRFIAALMVFFSHYPLIGLGSFPERIMASGYAGVTFFFVLSGFIITYNYIDKFESKPLHNTPMYLWARFSRVYPLYILTMLFVWLQKDAVSPLTIYLFAAQAWHPDASVIGGLNSPAWSISVEAFLYLCFPVLIPLFKRIGILRPSVKMAAAALLVVVVQLSLAGYLALPPRHDLPFTDPNSAHRWLYNFPLTRILDFTLGIFAAAYFCRSNQNKNHEKHWSYAAYSSIISIIALMASKANYLSSFSWDASYAGLFALLILAIAKTSESFLSRLLSIKPVVLLGEASFAFYLIHIIALPLFALNTHRSFFTGIVFEFLFLGLIITMSIGMHLTVEKPCRWWLMKLVRGRDAQPTFASKNSLTENTKQ
ncbi:acyltransferase [Pseudomonas sp. GW101-3H06]|uniref:acyltransferase family protein n=1 Tax=Pseudomonas sp. GW101-3H06 TaxID=2751347 RepID=UPI001A92867C|nr:acyltransferase [Pseudomonas sp. GW101-3H06]